LTGSQTDEAAIPEAVAMESTAMETELAEPVAEMTEGTTPELGTTVAPELRMETRVDSLPGATTDVIVRKPIIEDVELIHLAPMPEATSSSRGGLELLDDNLIDPAIVARSMESWRHTEQGSRYVASTLSSLVSRNIEYT
jgi:hypothetical protein